MSMIGKGDVLPLVYSNTNALRSVGIAEDFFSTGHSFTYSDYLTYTSDEVKDFVFDPTSYTPPAGAFGRIVSFVPCISATAGPVTGQIYAGTIADNDGTLLTVFNRDATSSNVNQSIIRLNPTITNIGIRFSGILAPGTGTSPATSSPGEDIDTLPFAMDITKKYLLRITNTNGSNVVVRIRMTFFEI